MRVLKELAFMVNSLELKTTLKHPSSLDDPSDVSELFKGIIEGEFQSDEEAAALLFPDSDNTSKYRKLKSKLKRRLKDAILLFDERNKDLTDYQKAYYICHKEWSIVKILIAQNAREAAIDIAQGIMKKAKKFEFTYLVRDMCSVLRLHYGTRMGDINKFRELSKELKHYKAISDCEDEVQQAYIELISSYVNSKSPKLEQHQRAVQALDQIEPLYQQHKSFQIEFHYFLVKLMVHTTVYDASKALSVCTEAIDCFEAKPYLAPVPLQTFYYHQLVAFIQLKRFEEGRRVVDQCLKLVTEGRFNWFKFYELYFLLAVYTENYEEAKKLFETTTAHSRFEFLSDSYREIWKIYHAYLYYLHRVGRLKESPKIGLERAEFKLGKFLNEVLIFSKDKSGLNATILIIQILILIVEGRHDETLDKFEPTKQYCYRYLQTDFTQRTYLFLKMLLKVQQIGFNREKIVLKTQKILKQLQELPLELANQAIELEIIPYETLWDFLLETLD